MTFAERRIVAVQFLGDDEAEHRVPEEFEPLVRFDLAVRGLVQVGAVVQRLLQHLRIVEAKSQRDTQLGCRPASRYRALSNHSANSIQ